MAVTTPQPTPILPSGPLARYLAHPGAEAAQLLHHLGHLAGHLGVIAGPVGDHQNSRSAIIRNSRLK